MLRWRPVVVNWMAWRSVVAKRSSATGRCASRSVSRSRQRALGRCSVGPPQRRHPSSCHLRAPGAGGM
eukprot:6289438-Lingulodinium_polyedra.AAC.1